MLCWAELEAWWRSWLPRETHRQEPRTTVMQDFEALTYLGQTRRLRRLALRAVTDHGIEATSVRLLGHGENTTYRVETATNTYLCRIHRLGYQTPTTIASELDWLRALRAETDLIVPRPLLAVGEPIPVITIPGLRPRPVVLFDWRHGRFELRRPRVETLRKAGRFLAALHTHTASWAVPPGFSRQRWDLRGLTGGNVGGSLALIPAAHRSLVADAVAKIAAVFDQLGDASMQLIHADLHGANRLLTADGRLAAIDFDDCGVGHLAYDIAVTLSYLRAEPGYAQLRTALLAGYREVRVFDAVHERAIEDFFALRRLHIWLWVLARRADHPTFRARAAGVTERAVGLLRSYVAGDSPGSALDAS